MKKQASSPKQDAYTLSENVQLEVDILNSEAAQADEADAPEATPKKPPTQKKAKATATTTKRLACVLVLALAGFFSLPALAQYPSGQLARLVNPDEAGSSKENGFGHDVVISGDFAFVGAPRGMEAGGNRLRGAVYIYQRQPDDTWTLFKKLTPSGSKINDGFGGAMAISGPRLLVSGFDGTYLFERDRGGTNNWGEVKRIFNTPIFLDAETVAIDGNLAVVGYPGAPVELDGEPPLESDVGTAYVFARHQGGTDNWGLVKEIAAGDLQEEATFGFSVSVSGNHVLIGAPGADGAQGAAYLFARNHGGSDNWGQFKKITASDSGGGFFGDSFGWSVALDGDIALIGARNKSLGPDIEVGAAYVFDRNQGGTDNWGEATKIIASDAGIDDHFGSSVALDGDIALIGAPRISGYAAYVFLRDQGGTNNWGQVKKLTPIFPPPGFEESVFGAAVALSGAQAIVAGPNFLDRFAAGTAYIFGPAPDLKLSKSDGDARVPPGNRITYTLNASNVGQATASGVVITETVPTGTTFDVANSDPDWACTGTAPGSTCTFDVGIMSDGVGVLADFAVTVVNPLPAGVEHINNTASIADDGTNGSDANPSDNTASDTTPVDAAPDLRFTKDDDDVTVTPGDGTAYNVRVTNDGNQGASGVTLTETIPTGTIFDATGSDAGWTCTGTAPGSTCTLDVGTLAGAGGTTSVIFGVSVDTPVPAGIDEITNIASAHDDKSNGDDPTPHNNTASDTTPVVATPDLTLTKDDGGLTVIPGQPTPYTLTVTNDGNQGASGVTLTETVPDHATFDATNSDAGWTCTGTAPGSTCTLVVGDLAGGGGSSSVIFAVLVDTPLSAGVEQIDNSASVVDDGANGDDPTPDNNTTSDATPVTAAPDLSLAKDDGGATVIPGEVIVYTLTVTNNGDQGATGLLVAETVPTGTTFDASNSTDGWVCLDVTPGSGCTFAPAQEVPGGGGFLAVTFAVVVDNLIGTGLDVITNTASVIDDGSNGDDLNPDDNVDTDTTPIAAEPDLALTKDDGGLTAIPGQVVAYTLTATNNGDQNATGVAITETVPTGTTFDEAGSDAGWSCTGGDPAGTGCTFSLGDLAGGGASAPVVFAVLVDKPLAAGIDEIDNTASVADDGANGDDPNPDDNIDTDTTPVDAMPVISSTLVDALVVDVDGDGQADPGDTVEYTATVSNTGDQDASDVSYTQTVDAQTSLSCATVDPGAGTLTACTDGAGGALTVDLTTIAGETTLFKRQATATITFQATVNVPLSSSVTEVSTQGTVEFTGDSGTESVVTDDPETTPLGNATATLIDQEADLALEKTASNATPDYQSEVVYTLHLTNDGPTTPATATVEEALPEGLAYVSHTGAGFFDPGTNTWTISGISFGSTAEIEITARVETIEPVTNTACITETSFPDPDASDNCDDATITPVAADLALVKTLAAFVGDAASNIITATFTLRVTNHGPSTATGVVVSDPLPEGAVLVSATGTGSYSAATGLWTVGALAKDATATLAMVLTAEGSNNLVNRAEVTGDEPDHKPGNNVAASQAQHDNPALDRFRADLSLVKTVDNATPSVGEEVTFTLTLTNGGPSATAGVQVRDLIEPDSLVELVSVETTGTATYADALWAVGHVPNGGTATLTVTVRILGAGTLTNTAEIVASTLPDPDSKLGNGTSGEDDFARVTLTASGAQAPSQAAVREDPASEAPGEAPRQYALGANYPNPFNPETVIPYAVPEAVSVRIAVYDLLGREVALLVDRNQAAGRYAVRWRAASVATGMYLVRMEAGSFSQVRRVTVVK